MTDAARRPPVLTEDLGPVRRLTMNRPKALNALSGELIDAMSDALRAAAADENVRVLILRGAGRAFCAGYDLTEDADAAEARCPALVRGAQALGRRDAEVLRPPQADRSRRCTRTAWPAGGT